MPTLHRIDVAGWLKMRIGLGRYAEPGGEAGLLDDRPAGPLRPVNRSRERLHRQWPGAVARRFAGRVAGSSGELLESGDELAGRRPVALHHVLQPLQCDREAHQKSGETHRDQPGHSREVNRRQVSSGSRNATGL